MKRSEAARYARWSAAVALLLAAITFAAYLGRLWARHLERGKAPPPAPLYVSRQSASITFKKVEQNRTIFSVDASHSTEFKGQNANLLEDVKITVFGKTAERHDVIHTKSCRYANDGSRIECSGDVQIDLMSASDAETVAKNPEEAPEHTTHVETRGVTLDRNNGLVKTDQAVGFLFPAGRGQAVGLEYSSEQGTLRLLKDVRLTLRPPAKPGTKNRSAGLAMPQEVHIRGASLELAGGARLLRLEGPVLAETAEQRLTTGEISLSFDEQFRASKMVAGSGRGAYRPMLVSQGRGGHSALEADTLRADFSPQGAITNLEAAGAVHASRLARAEQDELRADVASLELWPRVNEPKELRLRGHVLLKTQTAGAEDPRVLETSALRIEFTGARAGTRSKLEKAETLASGALEWTDAAPSGAPSGKTKLQADKLTLQFTGDHGGGKLEASGNVEAQRFLPGRPLETANAKYGQARLASAGGWSELRLWGDVQLQESDRVGQADLVVLERASQTAVLTGHAVARDATAETRAPRITFVETTAEFSADGGVRSADFRTKKDAFELAPTPAIITADKLQGNSKTGRAFYTGHARFWQGDSVLEADSIELLRAARTLNASGGVRAVFPGAPAKKADKPSRLELWHVSCGSLTYSDLESHAHLVHDVLVESGTQQVRASTMDLYFTPALQANEKGPGFREIARAVATGGVMVQEAGRQATADRGEYTAAEEKFVMSGGNPTIYDGSAGTTTGRQLTFFLADDTIIVDSENGSRTLTKHRVQK